MKRISQSRQQHFCYTRNPCGDNRRRINGTNIYKSIPGDVQKKAKADRADDEKDG